MSIPREGSRDSGKGIIVSTYPDVCYAKKKPVPFSIYAIQEEDANTAPSVRMTSQRAHNMGSMTTCCHGDEPGVAGVKSGTVGSICEPKTHSATVRIEGKHAIRHTDEWWMNRRNTVGKLNWVESTETFEPTPPLKQAHTPSAGSTQPANTIMSDASPPAEFSAAGAQLAFLDTGGQPTVMRSATGTTTSLPGAPTSQGQLAVPGGPGQSGVPPATTQPSPPAPEERWWQRIQMPRLSGGAGGPAVMELMAYLEHTLDQYVYRPDEWLERGFLKSPPQVSSQPTGIPGDSSFDDLPVPRTAWPPTETDEQPQPNTITDGNSRVTADEEPDDRRCGCLAGAYREIRTRCAAECGKGYQAHHVVPDYTLRYGTRDEGERGEKRIPGLPSFLDGPAICLEGYASTAGSEHGLAHLADAEIALLASGGSSPQGTLDIDSITDISTAAADAATGYNCTDAIEREIARQPSLRSDILGRATIMPPLEGDPAYNALQNGLRMTYH